MIAMMRRKKHHADRCEDQVLSALHELIDVAEWPLPQVQDRQRAEQMNPIIRRQFDRFEWD